MKEFRKDMSVEEWKRQEGIGDFVPKSIPNLRAKKPLDGQISLLETD